MYIELEEKCELVVENLKAMKKAFRLDTDILKISAAMYMANKKMTADAQDIKDCYGIIKKHEGVLSLYRNNLKMIMSVRMLEQENPEAYFLTIKEIAGLIDSRTVFQSSYAVLAAMLIHDQVQPQDYMHYASLTKVIYQHMKEEHRFLTGEDDMGFAALLAVSGIDLEHLKLEINECFELLKEEKMPFEARQELSHILALDMGAPTQKVAKVKALFDEFKRRKKKYGRSYEFVSLGMLALIDLDVSELCDMVIEVEEWLKVQDGFHGLSCDRATRLMIASDFVVETFKPEDYEMDSVLQYITMKIAIAQQAAAAAAAA